MSDQVPFPEAPAPQPPMKAPATGLVGFILSLLGFCGITAVAGIVLGVIGRKQAKQIGAGTGLPTAAIAIGAAWLGLLIISLIVGIAVGSSAPSSSTAASGAPSAPPSAAAPASPGEQPSAAPSVSQGPDYLAILPSGQLTNADTCPAYTAVLDTYTAKAEKLLNGAKKVPNDPYKASSYRNKNDWVSSDFVAEYSSDLDSAAVAALDALSGNKASQVASIDTYLADSLSECGLSQAASDVQAQADEVNSLASEINEAADSRPWYPKGYEEWVDGVAFRYNQSATNNNSLWGWAYDVISRDGCPNGLYVEVNFVNGGTIVDYGNDLLGSLPADRKALVQLRVGTSSNGVDDFEVSEVSCY